MYRNQFNVFKINWNFELWNSAQKKTMINNERDFLQAREKKQRDIFSRKIRGKFPVFRNNLDTKGP